MGSLALAELILGAVVYAMRIWGREVTLCRHVLTGLAQGTKGVERAVDWHHLTALGADVGATYTRLPSAQEQRQFRRAFIQEFAKGFQQHQGTTAAFVNWRVLGRERGVTTVAVDYPAKRQTLVFRVSGWLRPQLQTIAWMEDLREATTVSTPPPVAAPLTVSAPRCPNCPSGSGT
jgi:hypothetical protein